MDELKPWKRLGSRTLHRHDRVVIREDVLELPAGPERRYPVMQLGQSAGVACESLIAPGLSSSDCGPNITSANALDVVYALWRTPFLWLAPIAEPVPVLALAIGVSVWTRALARRPKSRRPATWS